MCLAVPARIVQIRDSQALVDAFGCEEEVDIRFIPDAKPGDFVLVHVGFAIQRIAATDARDLMRLWETALGPVGDRMGGDQ